MNRAGQVLLWLAFLAIPIIAIVVTESVWGGIIVAALEIGFHWLLRIRRQSR